MAINLLKINAEAVLCTGDLHGNLNSIGYQIKQFGIQNSVLICCGGGGCPSVDKIIIKNNHK